MTPDVPQIVERDGEVVRIVVGTVEVLAALLGVGDEIVLDRLSVDGDGPGRWDLSGFGRSRERLHGHRVPRGSGFAERCAPRAPTPENRPATS